MGLKKVRFEVFGIVQGVHFRVCTRDYANNIGVKGWVRNTEKGSVEGEIEGEDLHVDRMKYWLRNVGSPGSTISWAQFEETSVNSYSINHFSINR